MSGQPSRKTLGPRATSVLWPEDVSKILTHRLREGEEQYLIRWKQPTTAPLPEAVCSWHSLTELTRCLHLIQAYLEQRQTVLVRARRSTPSLSQKRKRNSHDFNSEAGHVYTGLLTPSTSSRISASVSVVSDTASIDVNDETAVVYNGVLERREGRIIAKSNSRQKFTRMNALKLPTQDMLDQAANAPITHAQQAIRRQFQRKVKQVPKLFLENDLDDSTPPLEFVFISDYVLGNGVYRVPASEYEGCSAPCRPNMGQYIGCEYTTKCQCLEYAAVDEDTLKKKNPDFYQQYAAAIAAGDTVDTLGLPKRFPYTKPTRPDAPARLQAFYRESRHPIYECNANCNCGKVCKSRLVQSGRKVGLTIFKTENRGWGVYCNEDLVQGEFIDTYLGEVITSEEADRREENAGKQKSSYMYSLDKFVGDTPELTAENCFVVDGQYMGGVTRFINHSCEPNCRQYTVSYNRHDPLIYDLAFFAYRDIPSGTELTFDYLDKDELEETDVVQAREAAARDPSNHEKVVCSCGSRKCRGYLWV